MQGLLIYACVSPCFVRYKRKQTIRSRPPPSLQKLKHNPSVTIASLSSEIFTVRPSRWRNLWQFASFLVKTGPNGRSSPLHGHRYLEAFLFSLGRSLPVPSWSSGRKLDASWEKEGFEGGWRWKEALFRFLSSVQRREKKKVCFLAFVESAVEDLQQGNWSIRQNNNKNLVSN